MRVYLVKIRAVKGGWPVTGRQMFNDNFDRLPEKEKNEAGIRTRITSITVYLFPFSIPGKCCATWHNVVVFLEPWR